MRKAFRTTLIGGVFFLIPLVFIGFLLGKAFQFTFKLVNVLDNFLPISTIGGAVLLVVLAILLIFVFCYLAGLLARIGPIARRVQQIDTLMVEIIPGYTIAKTTLSGVTGEEVDRALKVVEVTFDDHALLAFEVERLPDDRIVVFLPGAPGAWSGNTVIVEADRVKTLPVSALKVAGSLKVLGRGTGALMSLQPAR